MPERNYCAWVGPTPKNSPQRRGKGPIQRHFCSQQPTRPLWKPSLLVGYCHNAYIFDNMGLPLLWAKKKTKPPLKYVFWAEWGASDHPDGLWVFQFLSLIHIQINNWLLPDTCAAKCGIFVPKLWFNKEKYGLDEFHVWSKAMVWLYKSVNRLPAFVCFLLHAVPRGRKWGRNLYIQREQKRFHWLIILCHCKIHKHKPS